MQTIQSTLEMSKSAVLVLVALGLPYFVFAVAAVEKFITYCDYVAKATGRQKERQKFWNTDDGGMNDFEREQYGRLRRGDYMGLSDPKIVALGEKLTRRFRQLLWAAIGLLVSVVATAAIALA